jgi:leucyl-tRNA synthetase
MSVKYDHSKVEAKWQEKWAREAIYKTTEIGSVNSKKRYVLDMFPYPSGSTMHVGHLEGYVGTDILSRYLRMKGFSVLHPMGWDAFGLPAENYAIKTGIKPDKSTHDNIKNFKRQLDISGMSYDWTREIDTSSPEFYKWTQWLFILMFKNGLAYKKKAPVNWCPKDETVLANEQVEDGKCERCDTPVIQKELDQWFLKITDYADRLISGLEKIDWLDEVKRQQVNWIGRSEGMVLEFKMEGSKDVLKVFTTRPDTLESVTFMAVADNGKSASRDEEKTGKSTGKYAINPLTGGKIPVWETNYVASDYGTGAIMGVPGYDERDREFAKKYKLDILEKPFNKDIEKIALKGGWGKKEINYHIRDWLISRQRYWGCPIPMVYCKDCGWQPVPEAELPVILPTDVDFLPHGESPIERSGTFQKGVKCSKCGGPGRREVDTMDTYVDSSWYFVRFADPDNKKEFASKEATKKWMPVNDYVGGGHVVQHLLFARFFWKVLYDQNVIDKSLGDEPFLKLRAPGWILGSDSRKMSKRWGNVVTPDDVIPKFGADTLRVYEMFMGPFEVMKPWSTTGVEGASRFLGRVWRLFQGVNNKDKAVSPDVTSKLHQTIKKIGSDIEQYKFNTAISSLMQLVNTFTEHKVTDHESLKTLALLLAPFAPHMMEEVWETCLKLPFTIHKASWPSYESKHIRETEVTVIVQVNGKVRGQLVMDADSAKDQKHIESEAKKDEKAGKWLKDQKVKKVIFVPCRLINFVI